MTSSDFGASAPKLKTCRKCSATFDGRNCKACKVVYAAKYRVNNKDKVSFYNSNYRKSLFATPEIAEKNRGNSSDWKKNNRDRINAKIAEKKAKDPEKYRLMKAAQTARHKRPEGAAVIHASNRRARKLANGGRLSKGLTDKLFKLQQGRCACCGLPLGDNYHLDHIEPLSRGGSNSDENMQLLTQKCNSMKSAKDPIEYMQSRGFLL